MKILHPDNFFLNNLFALQKLGDISVKSPAMLLSKLLSSSDASAAFLPIMDLVTHHDFFISKKYCLGFDGQLSDSFIYFKKDEEDFDHFDLSGNISTTESLLLKFLMKENYEKDIQLQIIDPNKLADVLRGNDFNILVAGDENFKSDKFLTGLSFADEIVETFDIPYINYLLASKSEEDLRAAEKLFEGAEENYFSAFEQKKWENPFSANFENYLQKNYSRLILELTPDDIDAAMHLIRMPYYHGMVEDLNEIKFI